MLRSYRLVLSLSTLFVAAACADNPVAPPTSRPTIPAAADPSILTPILLPPGADWGLYFISFNRNRSLAAEVTHDQTSGAASGRGTFLIPGFGSGVLQITSAETYGGYVPNGQGTSGVPESAHTSGVALLSGPVPRYLPFTLDLHSNYWPNPENTFDTATLSFPGCGAPVGCTFSFFGELHHEPQ